MRLPLHLPQGVSVKKIVSLLFTLQFLSAAALFAESAANCSTCSGVVSDLVTVPGSVVPLLVHGDADALEPVRGHLAAMSPLQRASTTVVLEVSLDPADPISDVEKRSGELVTALQPFAPLDGLGVTLRGASPETLGYAVKRIAVRTQGLNLANNIVLADASIATLSSLETSGGLPYVDRLIVDASSVGEIVLWVAEHDPSKKIQSRVTATHANPLFDAAQQFAAGATTAFLTPATPELVTSVAEFNRELVGDYAVDSSSDIQLLARDGSVTNEKPVAMVRGEDLRTIVVPPGSATEWRIASVRGDEFLNPRRIDVRGDSKISDVGKKGGRFLIGLPPAATAYAVTLDRPNLTNEKIARETIDVATSRGITVEEIIRNHQAYDSYQESIEPRYVARNETKLRFSLGPGGDAVEAAIAGDFFSTPGGASDWVWKDFYINGVKWKYGRMPELPIIQPEKVSQLPLDIHLTNEYRYQLVRDTVMNGYKTYEVRFEPPPNAAAELPLYRGTVWIDTRTWARIRIAMIQLNLTGEVLSNEEQIEFVPFDRQSGRMFSVQEANAAPGASLAWLPLRVSAQQSFSVAGRATVVQRATDFTHFQLNPEDFESRYAEASKSDARMVRDTDEGLRYLEKKGDGTRVVKSGFDKSRLFLVGGIHHDAGLEFPVVPLGGIDYINFDLGGRGYQTNVFFAGVIVAANLTHPSVLGTRTNAGVDFTGIAIPFENVMYRGGEESESEAVKTLPIGLSARVGHPILGFGKIDVSLGARSFSYQRAETTGAGFEVPPDTFELTPGIDARYDRAGYSASVFFDRGMRTKWEPWGLAEEYDAAQKNFSHFGGALGKSFYLPRFQRLGLEAIYLDGTNLDRFSKYELGFFGAQRVHGVKSGSVRAEKAMIGHLSYGFVISEQFRIEAYYDHALLDDASAGYRREPFQGIGISGQTIGPWGTLLRFDIGKTVGRNAEGDFVANVVFLKLFG